MTESSAASDRRAALRREMNIPVWIEKQPPQPGYPSLLLTHTRDISNRGAFLWVPAVFSVGQRLRLEMEVAPDAKENLGLKIRCDAEVVRLQPANPPANPSGMAVRILSFDTPRPVLFPEN